MFIDKGDLGTLYLVLVANLELYKKDPTMFKDAIERLERVCTKIEGVLNGEIVEYNIDTIIEKCNKKINKLSFDIGHKLYNCDYKEQYSELLNKTKNMEKYHSTVDILNNIKRGLL